jgi:hypothetical protein
VVSLDRVVQIGSTGLADKSGGSGHKLIDTKATWQIGDQCLANDFENSRGFLCNDVDQSTGAFG